jgi:sensor histidine kinase regulating citrate/malate metabolism
LIEGSITAPIAAYTGVQIPFVVAGIFAGEKIHDRVNEFIFSIIVFSMLLVTGFFMLFL